MKQYLLSFDNCVTDACAFLGIERQQFFQLASVWGDYVRTFHDHANPEDFYRGFVGEAGRSNLCANILDQFCQLEVATVLPGLPVQGRDGAPLSFADFGCGTAALSFPVAVRFGRAHLVDLPNLAQDFVAWRCRRHGCDHIQTGTIGAVLAPVDVALCIDVLEHIAESSAFFARIDQSVRPGGVLILRAPWHSVAPHVEHLPAAEADWLHRGGAAMLAQRYDKLRDIQYGGIYRKRIA